MLQILPIQVLSADSSIPAGYYQDEMLIIISLFQKSDEGWFECQISSTPVISHLVYLDIAGRRPQLSFEYSQLPFKVWAISPPLSLIS